ncbi:hypothetical protein BZA77DRAFT_357295 [Pyronema omphalodes]|nr:hypothetical protein BZA77DRAFT_357295 [Pyronema omphalodes]
MFSLIKNSLLSLSDRNKKETIKTWIIKYLYGCSDKNNVQDTLTITGSQEKANLGARMYLVEQAAIGITPLCITICGVSLYLNPTNPHPTKPENVIGAWAEPCPDSYQKNDQRYSDSECFFSSINLLARAVLLAHSAGLPKVITGDFVINKLYCGPKSKDGEYRSRVTGSSGQQGMVRLKTGEYFVGECGIKEPEFQNVNAVLEIWSRPSVEGVKPGDLLLVWTIPRV